MRIKQKYFYYKKTALGLVFVLVLQIISPTVALALTSGPTQPEFTGFTPVTTTNMVNEFSGDFTYNIPVINVPGAHGGGYPLSLSYNSGGSPEQEASWVGLNWTLNPGSIIRNKRGYPDDWKEEEIIVKNRVPRNWTVSVGGGVQVELFSYDIPASLNASIRYNNYQGFGYSAGVGFQLGKGVISLGFHVTDGEGSFSLGLNPSAALKAFKNKGKKTDDNPADDASKKKSTEERQAEYKKNPEKRKADARANRQGNIGLNNISAIGSSYGLFTYSSIERNVQVSNYTGESWTLTPSVLGTLTPLQAGPTYNLFGNYSFQKNQEVEQLNAFGYMYSSDAEATNLMDYYVEKSSTYNKRDKFLGIPFGNVDNYSISGEGIGGGFRMHHKKIGHFRPNYKDSETTITNIGFEVEAGLNIGGGADLGTGSHHLVVDQWKELSSFQQIDIEQNDEPILFRFNNDMGGEVKYGNDDTKQKAAINFDGGVIGVKKFSPALPSNLLENRNQGDRVGRSSYIGYTTNDDIENRPYRQYSHNQEIENDIDRSAGISDQIGEFKITNEDGLTYVYGLPVYSRKEKTLQYGLEGLDGSFVDDNYLAYWNFANTPKSEVGEERPAPYATSYLLTEITDPDYIDRTLDGITEDDFGGWTKFHYARSYGGNDKVNSPNWFKWRIPYNGLLYYRNELSTPEDDMGVVNEGEKEIYYLEKIETKTHYAIFSTSPREDGLSASEASDVAHNSNAQGTKKLSKLDKIELYAKVENGTDQLIKRVRFEYDYSLCGNVINNTRISIDKEGNSVAPDSPNNINQKKGKLTLKKVWFEYEGIVNTTISPYVFDYEYPNSTIANYPTRYDGFENFGAGLNQNPNYSPFSIDPWGNYQEDGATRYANMKNWVNQAPPSSFDPAAWHLKVIKLPSGGQIHVQYGQDDYCYVQDQLAHSMVSLIDIPLSTTQNKYYLRHEDLNINTIAELIKLRDLLHTQYVSAKKKIYFKFLYKLIGSIINPQLQDCNAEYITGYVNVKEVGIDNSIGTDRVYVKLGNPGFLGNLSNHDMPKKVCKEFVKTQKAGKLSEVVGICDASVAGVDNTGNIEDVILNFVDFATMFGFPTETCREVNLDLSYLRVPSVRAKKGGGARVERLLLFDEGIDTGYPQLFGSEYLYKTKDNTTGRIISSGVATNEPQAIREENVLVSFLERFKQSFANKIIAGRDKKQAEGFIGESILPAPSVGYSKVIIKNIHSGKTNPGFLVKEFHTVKEKPYTFKSDMTELDNSKKDYLPLPLGLVNKFVNNQWLSQGFLFTLNNMHGQPKSEATYGGKYNDIHSPSSSSLSSLQEFTYFDIGEEVPFWHGFDKPISYGNPGKETELVFESRLVSDINNDGNIEGDVDVGLFGIVALPFLSVMPSLTFSKTELRTHTTTKIIRYPAIVKSIKTYQDGIYHITNNKYFDPLTGQALVRETFDGFNELDLLSNTYHKGRYTAYDIPAYREYKALGQVASNERLWVKTGGGVTIDKEVISGKAYLSFSASSGNSVCDAMNKFVPGDLISVDSNVYHIGEVIGSEIEILPVHSSSLGNSFVGNVDVEIAKSGKQNRLSTKIGNVTTYGDYDTLPNPIDPAVLAPRQALVSLLNDALNNGTPIYPSQIPLGLEFIDENGNCGTFPVDRYITIENGVLKIIGPVTPTFTEIVGTPNNPHPMVIALNSYLSTYFGYGLNSASTTNTVCTYGNESSEQLLYSSPDANYMLTSQNTDLTTNFTAVNGTTHSISDFFVDRNHPTGYASTIKNPTSTPPSLRNACVILKRATTGVEYGICRECNSLNNRIMTCISDCSNEFCGVSEGFKFDPGTIQVTKFGQNEDGFLTYTTVYKDSLTLCELDIRFYEQKPSVDSIKCESQLVLSGNGDLFSIDPENGRLVFYSGDNNCYPQPLNCLQFCEDAYPSTIITNVVASNAITMDDFWPYPEENYFQETGNFNVYQTGEKGKWRQKRDLTFRTNIAGASSPYDPVSNNYTANSPEKIYNAGVYQLDLYNWKYEGANDPSKWLNLSTVLRYSPHGHALEEENILGIKSCAKFGYNDVVTYLIAQNSSYQNALFESFENRYINGTDQFFEDGLLYDTINGDLSTNFAHSGTQSFKLSNDIDGFDLLSQQADEQVLEKGLLLKVWVKSDAPDDQLIAANLKVDVRTNNGDLVSSYALDKIAQTGEWTLYESKLNDLSTFFNIGDEFRSFLKFDFNNSGVQNIWIDDLRLQPMDAQMNCYVYDKNTLRLTTSFDDQHFGLYYRYNAEGKLIGRLIETERGLKTVEETQYNQKAINRN